MFKKKKKRHPTSEGVQEVESGSFANPLDLQPFTNWGLLVLPLFSVPPDGKAGARGNHLGTKRPNFESHGGAVPSALWMNRDTSRPRGELGAGPRCGFDERSAQVSEQRSPQLCFRHFSVPNCLGHVCSRGSPDTSSGCSGTGVGRSGSARKAFSSAGLSS